MLHFDLNLSESVPATRGAAGPIGTVSLEPGLEPATVLADWSTNTVILTWVDVHVASLVEQQNQEQTNVLGFSHLKLGSLNPFERNRYLSEQILWFTIVLMGLLHIQTPPPMSDYRI